MDKLKSWTAADVRKLERELREAVKHNEAAEAKIATLQAQLSKCRGVLRRMDWLEGGDQISSTDANAIKETLAMFEPA